MSDPFSLVNDLRDAELVYDDCLRKLTDAFSLPVKYSRATRVKKHFAKPWRCMSTELLVDGHNYKYVTGPFQAQSVYCYVCRYTDVDLVVRDCLVFVSKGDEVLP